jgi:ketosteroid isomerase-like protein
MSQENVQVARAAIEAWNDGDMDRLRNLYDPAAVYRTPPDWVEAGPYLGRDAIMRQFSELREVWRDNSSFERVDLLDAGDRVVVQVDFHGDTRGLPLTTEMAWVYTMRNGLIVSLEIFHSREEAVQALELSE